MDGHHRRDGDALRPSSSRHGSDHAQARPSRLSQTTYPSTSSSKPSEPSSSRHAAVEVNGRLHPNSDLPDRGQPNVATRGSVANADDEAEETNPRLLDGVPLEVQEAWICEDLLFVLQVGSHHVPPLIPLTYLVQGIEGSLIRYEDGYDPLDESQRIRGARWQVDPSLGRLSPALSVSRIELPRFIASFTCRAVVTIGDGLCICRSIYGATVNSS